MMCQSSGKTKVLFLLILFTSNVSYGVTYKVVAEPVSIRDDPSGSGHSSSIHRLSSRSIIFFALINGDEGLHRFDADTQTTTFLIESSFSESHSFSPDFYLAGNKIVIDYVGKVFITDGTPEGTLLLREFTPFWVGGSPGILVSPVLNVVYAGNNHFYLTLWDGYNPNELWVSDGSSLGTARISTKFDDIKAVFKRSLNPAGVVSVIAFDSTNGVSLWEARSTGLELISSISDTAAFSHIFDVVNLRTGSFIHVSDGIWRLDNSGGLRKFSGKSRLLEEIDGALIYSQGNNLLRSNGVMGDAVKILDLSGTTWITDNCKVKDKIYFMSATASNETKLWLTDGTTSGSKIVFSFFPEIHSPGSVSLLSCDNDPNTLLINKSTSTHVLSQIVIFDLTSNTPHDLVGEENWFIFRNLHTSVIVFMDNHYYFISDDTIAKIVSVNLGYIPSIFMLLDDDH